MFDDYFTSTESRKTNILPSSWNDLFTHNHVNVLDGEPNIANEIQLPNDWNLEDSISHPIHEGTIPAPEGADRQSLPQASSTPSNGAATLWSFC
jgi:hypothetical protein